MKPFHKPTSPYFSCGPTKKPPGWNPRKLGLQNISRYHRSDSAQKYLNELLNRLKILLNIPKEYSIFLHLVHARAMESVIWSVLNKETKITSIVYDFWGLEWSRSIEKLNLKQEIRSCLNGKMPNLENKY